MIFKLKSPDGKVSWPFAVYTDGKPTIQVNFQWLAKEPPEPRDGFLAALALPPVGLDADQIRASGFKKRPNVAFARMTEAAAREQFVEAVRRLASAE
jgi:hypothetical protein